MKTILTILITLYMSVPCYAGGMMMGGGVTAVAPTGYSDDFTGTASTPLATHDANWTSMDAAWPVGAFILSGDSTVLPNAAYNNASAYYAGSASDTSQIVYKGQTHCRVGSYVAVRAGAASFGYSATFEGLTGGNWTVMDVRKNGTNQAYPTIANADCTVDHTIKIVASGTSTTTITVYVDGTAAGSTYQDSSTPITSGHPGFYSGTGQYPVDQIFDSWQDY
jgi:hypothetical protein